MTREELKKLIHHIEYSIEINKEVILTNDDCREIIKALERESCEDAISRQAVDELSKALVHTTRDKADFLCNFWEKLRKLSSVNPQPKTGWIPVGERLPKEHKEVLTCGRGGFIEIQSIELNYWENQNGDWSDIDDVIAWMPLPNPYEPQESEDI